jgi:hypothetical protein
MKRFEKKTTRDEQPTAMFPERERVPSRGEAEEYRKEKQEIKNLLMARFYENLATLVAAWNQNRAQQIEAKIKEEGLERTQPLITVIVSVWEESDEMISSKMLEHSLAELVAQAQRSGLSLDIIVVANNGGGATPELGHQMRERLHNSLPEKLGLEEVIDLETQKPENEFDATTPWPLEIATDESERGNGNRLFFVTQPFDEVNAGKIRALRDVTNALTTEIVQEGYAPDAIFQMDAETILEYNKPLLRDADPEDTVPPLKALFNGVTRGGYLAVGTKDRFEAMDPETGRPLRVPRESAQEGYMLANQRNFITLPGGALMIRPPHYIAGIKAISETTPGAGTEDYMLTKMLRDIDPGDDKEGFVTATSLHIVSHLNRCPQGPDAYKQLHRAHAGGGS